MGRNVLELASSDTTFCESAMSMSFFLREEKMRLVLGELEPRVGEVQTAGKLLAPPSARLVSGEEHVLLPL